MDTLAIEEPKDIFKEWSEKYNAELAKKATKETWVVVEIAWNIAWTIACIIAYIIARIIKCIIKHIIKRNAGGTRIQILDSTSSSQPIYVWCKEKIRVQ